MHDKTVCPFFFSIDAFDSIRALSKTESKRVVFSQAHDSIPVCITLLFQIVSFVANSTFWQGKKYLKNSTLGKKREPKNKSLLFCSIFQAGAQSARENHRCGSFIHCLTFTCFSFFFYCFVLTVSLAVEFRSHNFAWFPNKTHTHTQ